MSACLRAQCLCCCQSGRQLASLAIFQPHSPGPSLSSSACDLLPDHSWHGGVTARTSASSEYEWKWSHAASRGSELGLKALGLQSYLLASWRPVHRPRLETELVVAGGGACRCPRPLGVCYNHC